ncbi:MAG: response regulator, partial [Prolixibacteraceae bacterium]|nr:response regulator [Prolixibacteraceae bacterium]
MKKILAIDDQQDNLITIQAVLKNNIQDCRIFLAQSGEEGLELAEKEQPDTILLDIIMPRMDGYEVCKRLKSNTNTSHIPVVMITAIKTDAASRAKGLNMGADAFL